jgi:hypothetical protein
MQCKYPAYVYKDAKLICANCGSIDCKEPTKPVKHSWDKKCECGANKILGENNKHHASWCDLYIKP